MRRHRGTLDTEHPEPDRAESTENSSTNKVRLWAETPQPRADERTCRHHTIADEVVSAVGACAEFGRRLGNDKGFARRLAELLQPTHHERNGQPREVVGPQKRSRKQREEHKRREHEWALAMFVGEVRDRYVAEHCCHHFY